MKKSIVVNFFAAPGSGKSTMSADLFAKLKWNDVDCELVSEYAKDIVWDSNHETFKDQLYLFGQQHHRLFRLNGKVDVIITDSPILLSVYYNSLAGTESKLPDSFNDFARDVHHKFNNFNVFITRKEKYNPNGRNQKEEESDIMSNDIKEMLVKNKITFTVIEGNPENVYPLLDKVIKIIKNT